MVRVGLLVSHDRPVVVRRLDLALVPVDQSPSRALQSSMSATAVVARTSTMMPSARQPSCGRVLSRTRVPGRSLFWIIAPYLSLIRQRAGGREDILVVARIAVGDHARDLGALWWSGSTPRQ